MDQSEPVYIKIIIIWDFVYEEEKKKNLGAANRKWKRETNFCDA